MPKTSDIKIGGRICAIFKGKPGTRKTCAAATFPGPIYFFDFDGRMDPVKKMYPDRLDIEYDTYDLGDFAKANAKFDRIMAKQDKYRTVVFDSLTTFADNVLDFARNTKMPGQTRERPKIGGILPVSEIADFNIETTGLTQLMYQLKRLSRTADCNVIVTAHVLETVANDIVNKTQTVSRSLLTAGKKIAEKFPAVFNEVYHFETSSPGPGIPPVTEVYTDNAGADFAKTALPIPIRMTITGLKLYDEIVKECAKKGVEIG